MTFSSNPKYNIAREHLKSILNGKNMICEMYVWNTIVREIKNYRAYIINKVIIILFRLCFNRESNKDYKSTTINIIKIVIQ